MPKPPANTATETEAPTPILPSVEWLATAAVQIANARTMAGIKQGPYPEEEALNIWRRAALRIWETIPTGKPRDWYGLAIHDTEGFEAAAKAFKYNPYDITPDKVGIRWMDETEIACAFFPNLIGRSRPQALKQFEGLIDDLRPLTGEGLSGLSMVDELIRGERHACVAGDEICLSPYFCYFLSKNAWRIESARNSKNSKGKGDRSKAGAKAKATAALMGTAREKVPDLKGANKRARLR